MVIGVCRLVFELPGVDSLKAKRSIVRRIVERTRNKFNASVAEVEAMDSHRRAVLAAVVVSNDARHADSMLDEIGAFVGGAADAVLMDRQTELVPMGTIAEGSL